jgi:hypothetical protein
VACYGVRNSKPVYNFLLTGASVSLSKIVDLRLGLVQIAYNLGSSVSGEPMSIVKCRLLGDWQDGYKAQVDSFTGNI